MNFVPMIDLIFNKIKLNMAVCSMGGKGGTTP